MRNMDFNYAAMAVQLLLYIFFGLQFRSKSESGRCFRWLMANIICTAMLNVFTEYLRLNMAVHPKALVAAVYCAYAVFINIGPFFLSRYTIVLTKNDGRKTYRIWAGINIGLLAAYSVLCIINMWSGFLFYVTKTGEYVRGNGYVLIYLLSAYYLMFSLIRMLRYYSFVSKKTVISMVLFVAVTISGALLQFFVFGEVVAIYFVYTIATTILLFSFETPDYQKLMEATEALEKSRAELEDAKEKEEELTRSIRKMTKSAAWVLYFDENGEGASGEWSPEFPIMLGYEPGEYQGDEAELWANSLHPEDKERAVNAFMEGINGATYDIEVRLQGRRGEYRWYHCSGELNRSEDGKVKSFQGIVRDMQDEKMLQLLTDQRLQALEELKHSQEDLKKALFAAEEANRAKTIFLSNMSHDIRTPMNAIVGYTQLAREHMDDAKQLEECLGVIRDSGDHLLSLINDVLDMSRIESGRVKVEPVPCDLSELVKAIADMTKGSIAEKGHTFTLNTEEIQNPYVLCDRLRLNQILINCVGNSVKYTNNGGHISLTVSQKDGGKDGTATYIFRVRDDGIGMSSEFLKKIFEPFEREKTISASGIQGTGLGMAITKNLTEMMGGTIEVESVLGEGSEFIISLPLAMIGKEQLEAEELAASLEASMDDMVKALKGKKFLVVDDNRMNRIIAKRLLQERGMLVEECDSGAATLARLEDIRPGELDLIFMDIQMPEMDGYETTDRIRLLDNSVAQELPIVAMTANAFEEDRQNAKKHGMCAHVTKPFKIEELIKLLYRLLIIS